MPAPNLLFIMTDQQRYDALGANGNGVVRTPNLDALARAGVNVHDYFVNSPVCVPSRCNLFTGRYPHSHRVRENHNLLEYGREIHLFRVLKQAGYALGYVGKNHLLEKEEMALMDYWDEERDDQDDPALRDWHRAHAQALRGAGQPEIWRAGTFHDFPEESTRTYKTAAEGIRFLRERPQAKPFCLTVSFSAPHVPHLAPRRFEALYPLDSLQPYPRREGELDEKARRYAIKWRAQKADGATEADRRHYMAVYYGMISWVDEMVGRLLAELRAQGLEENTIAVFTSDHGEFCFEHGMCKKDLVLLDTLLHVPLIVRWPGVLAPRDVRGTLTEQVDVMPTLLDLMGLETPFGVQGESLAPVLRGDRHLHKDAVFAEVCPPWLYNRFASYEEFETHHGGWATAPFNVPGDFTKSIREERWRYVWYGTGEEELYDHAADPHEQHNRTSDPACAAEKIRLKLRLLEWLALSEDPIDPLSQRQLQAKYDAWRPEPRAVAPGPIAGPGWLEERFTPNPRRA